jgi:hypothetical protein
MTASAWCRLQTWLADYVRDIEAMRAEGMASSRQFKPQPLILDESDTVPEARGIIWDLRNPKNIVPIDCDSPIASDLHLDFLKVLMTSCPDRDLCDHILHGAHFKAELPLQTVLLPQPALHRPRCQYSLFVHATAIVSCSLRVQGRFGRPEHQPVHPATSPQR